MTFILVIFSERLGSFGVSRDSSNSNLRQVGVKDGRDEIRLEESGVCVTKERRNNGMEYRCM